MQVRRAQIHGAMGGVVVGVVAVVLLVSTGVLDRPAREITGDEALEALELAWTRHRSSEHVIEAEWRRTMRATGDTLRAATLSVSRPPDRLVRRMGVVRGVVNGSTIRCGTGPDGDYQCFATPGAPTLEQTIDEELDAWRSYTVGPNPLYAVTTDGDGCFDLDQLAPYPDPPYGRAARLCFDPESGALRYLRRELETAVEEQEALVIRTEVADADLDTGPVEGYEPVDTGGGLLDEDGLLPGLDEDGLLPGEVDPSTSTTAP